MTVYKFTKFTQQVSHCASLMEYRAAINARLKDLENLFNFNGQTIVVSKAAKEAILSACGSTMDKTTHIYEIGVGGHWRIFFAPSTGGSIIALMIGHLNGNTLETP